MRKYVQSVIPAQQPQFLHLNYRGRGYYFNILHAEEEHYGNAVRRLYGTHSKTHAHDVYHIVLYTQGRNTLIFNGREHSARRGTLVVTAPGDLHNFGLCGTGDVYSLEFTFVWFDVGHRRFLRLPFHKALSILTGLNISPAAYPVQLSASAVMLFEYLGNLLLDRMVQGGGFMWYAAEHLMMELFDLLIREVYMPHGHVQNLTDIEDDPLLRARQKIQRQYNETLTWKELAARACLSTEHFGRAFKLRFGISPMAYQQQLRMNIARVLLWSSSIRISRIAEKAGYANVYSFSKMFKKATGRSPREFRASHPRALMLPEIFTPRPMSRDVHR